MKPAQICKQILGSKRLTGVLGEFSSPQIKAVLKEGGLKVKLPGGYVSQQKRRGLWTGRIAEALDQDNDNVAGELLQQWLLHHRRKMLIDLLDHLGVKHRQGETDESFLVVNSTEKIRNSASWLLGQHERTEAVAYLYYVAFQQRSPVFDDWHGLVIPTSADDALPDRPAEDAGDPPATD